MFSDELRHERQELYVFLFFGHLFTAAPAELATRAVFVFTSTIRSI